MVQGRDADRLLPVHPGGRRPGGRLDRGPGLVLRDSDPLRHPRLRGARRRARHPRRPRQDRRRRLRPDPARHLRRRPAGLGLRREPARRAVRRRAGRDRRHQRQRLQQCRGQARERGPEPRLRVRLQGPPHRLRLRGRGPDSVQEPALSAGAGAALGHQRDPAGAALGRGGLVGAGQARERLVPVAVGAPRRADRAPPRPGARVQSFPDLEDDRLARRRRLALRRRQPRAGRQSPLGRDQQSQPQRHRQSGFLPGRIGRRAVPVRPPERAVLLREAAVLPRRHRAVHHAQPVDLHPAHRAAGGGGQAHRQGLRHRHRAALRRGRSRRVAERPRPPGLQPAAPAARRRRDVTPGAGVHRPDRRQRLQPRRRARRAPPLRRALQREPPARGEPHPHRGRHEQRAALVRALGAERPHLRLPGAAQRQRSRISAPGAASFPGRGSRTPTSIRASPSMAVPAASSRA